MGHSKVAAPGRLGTTGRTLAIGNCKGGSLGSVLIWDVGPGLAPARPEAAPRGGPAFKSGHYRSLGNPGIYLHVPVSSPSITSPAGRRYAHVPLARISHHRGKGRPPRAGPPLHNLPNCFGNRGLEAAFSAVPPCGTALPTAWRKMAERFEKSGLAIHRSPHALS